MKFGALLAVVLISALASCAPSTTLKSTFNASDAAFVQSKGTATINGQAFLRRNDGIVVYGAGSEVFLIPKTAYSDERMAFIYKGSKVSYFGGTFKNDDPMYQQYMLKTVADGEGRFTFGNVAAGSYYITTHVIWFVQYQQGGALMDQVTVGDGQSVQVIMSGM